jgi:hypothetical protein
MSRLAEMNENNLNMTKKKVLFLGIDPKFIDVNLTTRWMGCQPGEGGCTRGK